jgi:hypothetical protein
LCRKRQPRLITFARAGNAYERSLQYRVEPADEPRPSSHSYRLIGVGRETWQLGDPFGAESPGEWVQLQTTTSAVPSGTIADARAPGPRSLTRLANA